MIFNMGAVIGCLIPLGQNIHTTTNKPVTDGTYIGFIVLTVIGAGLTFTLVNAKDVLREDGSRVILMKNPSWKTELLGLRDTFISDPYILFLFPMFFSSNWFYTYQFNGGMYFGPICQWERLTKFSKPSEVQYSYSSSQQRAILYYANCWCVHIRLWTRPSIHQPKTAS